MTYEVNTLLARAFKGTEKLILEAIGPLTIQNFSNKDEALWREFLSRYSNIDNYGEQARYLSFPINEKFKARLLYIYLSIDIKYIPFYIDNRTYRCDDDKRSAINNILSYKGLTFKLKMFCYSVIKANILSLMEETPDYEKKPLDNKDTLLRYRLALLDLFLDMNKENTKPDDIWFYFNEDIDDLFRLMDLLSFARLAEEGADSAYAYTPFRNIMCSRVMNNYNKNMAIDFVHQGIDLMTNEARRQKALKNYCAIYLRYLSNKLSKKDAVYFSDIEKIVSFFEKYYIIVPLSEQNVISRQKKLEDSRYIKKIILAALSRDYRFYRDFCYDSVYEKGSILETVEDLENFTDENNANYPEEVYFLLKELKLREKAIRDAAKIEEKKDAPRRAENKKYELAKNKLLEDMA